MKHLGMLQPSGYWRSKQSPLILPLIVASLLGLIKCRNWIRNPVTPVHPIFLVAEEADKGTRTLVVYVSGVGEGTVCDSLRAERVFCQSSVLGSTEKRPALEDESLRSKGERALRNLYFLCCSHWKYTVNEADN